MGGPNAPLSPAESVRGVLAVLDTFQPEQSGYFYDYTGQPLSWWSIAHNSSHKTDGAMIFLVLSKQMLLKDKLPIGHMSVKCHTKVKNRSQLRHFLNTKHMHHSYNMINLQWERYCDSRHRVILEGCAILFIQFRVKLVVKCTSIISEITFSSPWRSSVSSSSGAW